ncbi:protein kilB [Amycolatopsis sp. FU40]|uniref:protein kilB n=1 Tax=Amycolatopsis sp. FU40 TaxID=2914159 RepID=UPI002715335B|nr:protein kilB [Amycolatopsis sp. FU40]
MSTIWTSLIAVAGTLAGVVTTSLVQRAARRENLIETRRSDLVSAVSELVAALAAHRRAMWVLEHRRLTLGADERAHADALAASHETRAAITAPLVKVQILAPRLRDAAKAAETAAYALRNAPDLDTLAQLREQALDTSDRLVAAAGGALAPLDRVRA